MENKADRLVTRIGAAADRVNDLVFNFEPTLTNQKQDQDLGMRYAYLVDAQLAAKRRDWSKAKKSLGLAFVSAPDVYAHQRGEQRLQKELIGQNRQIRALEDAIEKEFV